MNETRINEIAAAIGTDEKKIKEIAGMTLDQAQEYFRANGYSFTKEELSEFAQLAVGNAQSGEINENELEHVAGGFGLTAALTAGVIALIGANAAIFWGAHALDRASRRRYGRR